MGGGVIGRSRSRLNHEGIGSQITIIDQDVDIRPLPAEAIDSVGNLRTVAHIARESHGLGTIRLDLAGHLHEWLRRRFCFWVMDVETTFVITVVMAYLTVVVARVVVGDGVGSSSVRQRALSRQPAHRTSARRFSRRPTATILVA